MLTINATINATVAIVPSFVKSLSVLYPIKASTPKNIDVPRNTIIIDDNSYATNIVESVNPFIIAYISNTFSKY